MLFQMVYFSEMPSSISKSCLATTEVTASDGGKFAFNHKGRNKSLHFHHGDMKKLQF